MKDLLGVANARDPGGDLAEAPFGLGPFRGLLAGPTQLVKEASRGQGDRRLARKAGEPVGVVRSVDAGRIVPTWMTPTRPASVTSGEATIERRPASRTKRSVWRE